jgi:DNA-binding HxlR family transcriptional regulator
VRQTSFAEFQCSIARTMEAVGDWWSPLILRDVFVGVNRFDDLATDLGISRNLLTRRLDHLVEAGVLDRVPYQDRPVRHEYVLTESGRELVPLLVGLMAWGDRWQTPDGGPPAIVGHHGHPVRPQVTCADCGEPIVATELTVTGGPGGRIAPGTTIIGALLADG